MRKELKSGAKGLTRAGEEEYVGDASVRTAMAARAEVKEPREIVWRSKLEVTLDRGNSQVRPGGPA
jgi:hypothetical protein